MVYRTRVNCAIVRQCYLWLVNWLLVHQTLNGCISSVILLVRREKRHLPCKTCSSSPQSSPSGAANVQCVQNTGLVLSKTKRRPKCSRAELQCCVVPSCSFQCVSVRSSLTCCLWILLHSANSTLSRCRRRWMRRPSCWWVNVLVVCHLFLCQYIASIIQIRVGLLNGLQYFDCWFSDRKGIFPVKIVF